METETNEEIRFNTLNLNDGVLEGLDAMGFDKATPIQAQAIPAILENKDLIGCAQTGTGKTGAFVIPLLSKFSNSENKKIRCLALVPTRELALQIDQQIDGFGYFTSISSAPVFGGNQPGEFDLQKNAISQGCDILIATPGRLLSHLNLGYLDLSHIETLVLDEADRMLDMGFIGDIMKIVEHLPKVRQTLMFSATMAPGIRKLAKEILNDPMQINLAIAKPAEGVNQKAYLVHNQYKIPLLGHLLKGEEVQNMIIFASRKSSVDDIERALRKQKFSVKSIHSGRSQEERNQTMLDFKSGQFRILVATDIVSRGIDIDGLSHVLNYDLPDDPADYVHRVGRTARADKTGVAISFVNEDDGRHLAKVERLIEKPLDKEKTPEDIGPSPEYNPGRRGGGGGRKPFRKKGGGKGGRNKHHHRGNNNNNRPKDGQGGGGNNHRKKRRNRPGGQKGNGGGGGQQGGPKSE